MTTLVKYYRCHGLSAISTDRARNITDAARQFAHRFAMKLFGRAGRCMRLQRIGADKESVFFKARIGKQTGPSQQIAFKVGGPGLGRCSWVPVKEFLSSRR